MSSPEDNPNLPPKLNQRLRINAACAQFEDEWKRGNKPELNKFLNDSENSDRSELLHELLSIDSHWRWLNKQKQSRGDYEVSLPDDLDVIREFFDQRDSSLEQFIDRLSDSGLFSSEDAFLILKSLPAANRPIDAQELAQELVQQEKLTEYQAQQISQGTTSGLLLGDYLIQDVIGAGGMGQVYLAEHRRMDRRVALKMLPDAVAEDSQSVLRFQREVRAAAKLSHPNVVAAYDAGEDDGLHYFVMEWVEGTDLSRLIKQNGKLPVAKAVNYVLQAARALEYAHVEGVIHRDIKPANIMLDKKGTIKILDMGLARFVSPDDDNSRTGLTSTGMVMGTIDYMAPEQALDSKIADARSDIYSLGCILHFLLTGKEIYEGDTALKKIFAHRDNTAPSLSATHTEIPFALDSIFQKMVAKEPDDRQPSMTQVINELEAFVEVYASSAPLSETANSSGNSFDNFLMEQQADKLPFIDLNAKEQVAVTDEELTRETCLSADTFTSSSTQSKKQTKSLRRKIIPGLIVCLIGMTGLAWTAGVFAPVSKSEGTIIVDVDQPELAGAVVSVDGLEKMKLKTGDTPATIKVESDNKKHSLKVVKSGFEDFTKEFSVKAGKTQRMRVRLEPLITGQSSQRQQQPTKVDPHRRLAEMGIQDELKSSFWTSTDMIAIGDVKQLPLGRIAVSQLKIDGKQLKAGFDWKVLERVKSLERLICNTTIPVTTLKHLKGVRRLYLDTRQLSDRDVAQISKFTDLQTFILYSNLDVTDASCDGLAKLFSLRELDINNTGITGEGLKKLSKLPNLYSLSISLFKGISIQDLVHIQSFKSLYSLSIHNAVGDRELLEQLGRLHSLRVIYLYHPEWSEADTHSLRELLPDCSIIHSSTPPYEADQKVAQWVLDNQGTFSLHGSTYQKHKRLPQQASFALESIYIEGADGLSLKSSQLNELRSLEMLSLIKMTSTDTGLETVGKLSTLRYLSVSYSDVSTTGLEQIGKLNQLDSIHLKACPNLLEDDMKYLTNLSNLMFLDLSYTFLADDGLKHVSKISGLQDLILSSCPKIGSSGLEYLVALPKLRYLDLNSTQINDSAITHLQNMKGLRVLRIFDTKITTEGARKLQSALPDCVVFHESLEDVPWTGTPGMTNNLTGN